MPGEVPAVDLFVEGYEGTLVYVDKYGEEVMNSVKRLAGMDWAASASISTQEAFAPIILMQQRTLVVALLLSLLSTAATWVMLRRQPHPFVRQRQGARLNGRF